MTTRRTLGRIAGDGVEWLARGTGALAALTVLAMCLLITADVAIRALANYPIVWVPEIVGYLMVVLVFFALAEAMFAGSHIRIDLLINWIPKRLRDVLDLLTLTLSTGVTGLFAWHGFKVVMRSYQYGRKDAFGALSAPLWIPQIAIPIGLVVLTLVLALFVIRKLRVVLSGEDDPGSAPASEVPRL
jgi:TRAP-type C4-dicarboxylate transport system permease small subunit